MYLGREELGLRRQRRWRGGCEDGLVARRLLLVLAPTAAAGSCAYPHGGGQSKALRFWFVAQRTEEALCHGHNLLPLGRVSQTAFALDIAELLGLFAVVAPVLPPGEVIARIQVLEHELMVGEPLPATKQRALPPLLGGHLLAGIAFDGRPYNESVQGTLVARSIA